MDGRLQDTGEFELIEGFLKKAKLSAKTIKGIGDDCAVLRYKKQSHLLFTTDMIIEGIHFKKSADPYAIGHKALAVNISDISACGGIPRWAVVSAGLAKNRSKKYADKIFKGINNLADDFGIDIVGGDTNASDKAIISIALLGVVKKDELLLRSGAGTKELIALSGRLKPKPDDLHFKPPLEKSRYIIKHLRPTSMIDISDGLFSDLSHICKASKKSAIIYEALVKDTVKTHDIYQALNKGEQFELLFTMPRSKASMLPSDFYAIGEVTEGSNIYFVREDGKREKIIPRGYRHF
jgi:thiamine-monophosphate kinase